MLWSNRLFPVLMLLFPLVFTLLSGRVPAEEQPDAVRRMRRLWGWTLAALAVYLLVQAAIEGTTGPHHWLRGLWQSSCALLGFFALWFRLAVPALAARKPGWRPVHREEPGRTVRSASLVRRDRAHPIPRGAWIAGWAVFAACAGALAWSIASGASPWLVLGLGFWLGMGILGARASVLEPEPRDAAGSPELDRAWERFRRFKAWSFYACGLLGTAAFAAIGVLFVVAPGVAPITGALLGTLVGLAGGAFGTAASVYRARVHAHLHALSREAPGGD